jgi:hypothetical protein
MQGLHLLVPWRPRTTLRRAGMDMADRIGAKSIPRPGGHARPGDHGGPPESIGLASIPRQWKRSPQWAGDRGNSSARRSAKQS